MLDVLISNLNIKTRNNYKKIIKPKTTGVRQIVSINKASIYHLPPSGNSASVHSFRTIHTFRCRVIAQHPLPAQFHQIVKIDTTIRLALGTADITR